MSRVPATPGGWLLLAASAGFAAAAAAAFATRPSLSAFAPAGGLTVAAAVVASSALRRRCAAGVSLVLLVALAGFLRGVAAAEPSGPGRIGSELGVRPLVITGTVRSAEPAGTEAVVDATHITDADRDVSVSGGVLVLGTSMPALAPGDAVEVDAPQLRSPARRPGPRSEAALEREDIAAVAPSARIAVDRAAGPSPAGVLAWIRSRLVDGVNRILPEPAAALVLGIAFGIRRPLDAATRAALQNSGLIHIVVVSGLKVVIVIGLTASLAAAREWSRRRTALAVAVPVLFYVLLSGAGPAAVRSAAMAGVALLTRGFGRRPDPLPLLALTAAAMLAVSPSLALDAGFQLSFLGTAGIVILADPIGARIPGPRLLAEPFAVTLAAQAATQPVMAGTFGVVSLVGPLANALVLPLLPALIVVGGLGGLPAAVAPALGWLPLQIAGVGAGIVAGIGAALASIPGAALLLPEWPLSWTLAELAGLAAAAFVLLRWRRPRGGPASAPGSARRNRVAAAAVATGLLAGATTGVATSQPDGHLHAVVLDTASSTSVLIRAPDGRVALIDGGNSPQGLLRALGRVLLPFERRIDLVVMTGGESAAAAGLAGLAGHYSIGEVVAPTPLNPAAASIEAAFVASGAGAAATSGGAWLWAGARWSCLAFSAERTDRPMCAVGVDAPTGRMLVLGDAGVGDQEELVAMYGRALAADVLVAPPGGALAPSLLAAVRPGAIAIPAASGSPTAPDAAGYPASKTSIDGDLRFDGGPDGLASAG